MEWISVKDKSAILPSYKSGQILVTDGKVCGVVGVKAFLENVDKPYNRWTHWCRITLPKV